MALLPRAVTRPEGLGGFELFIVSSLRLCRRSLTAVCLCLTASVDLSGATLNLSAVGDTTLNELDPNHNMGAHSFLEAGTTGATGGFTQRRALMRFDLSAIPAGSTINSATLTMNVVFGVGSTAPFQVHRVLQPWGEGNKSGNRGSAASAGEATWNSRLHGSATWTGGGAEGNYTSTASATASLSTSGSGVFSGSSIQADVQAWVSNPAQNNGWLVRLQNEGVSQIARRIGSREGANASQLSINYTAPNSAPNFTSTPVTTAIIGAGYQYTATANDPDSHSVAFSKVSGPSWLNVAANGAVSGTPQEGDGGAISVTIRATDNSALPASQDQTYTVTVRATFAGWQNLHFALPAEAALAAAGEDPDGDRLPNLFEFALKKNPRVSDAGPSPVPTFNGSNEMVVSVQVRDDAPGLSVVAEIADEVTFGGLFSAGGILSDPTPGDGFATLTFTDNVSRLLALGRFARFKLTATE